MFRGAIAPGFPGPVGCAGDILTGEGIEKGQVTELLEAWRAGDGDAANRLFSLVYRELRGMARRQLRGRAPGQTLATTALVHEAYLKLVDRSRAAYNDRGHFFAVASRAMRQILVDHARSRAAQKRGGRVHKTSLDEERVPVEERAAEIVALDAALTTLADLDPRLVKVVEMRFFGGLSLEEVAEALQVSPTTVKRDWRKARVFLHHELAQGSAG